MKKIYTFFLAVFLLGPTVIAQNMDEVVHKYFNNHAGKSEVGFTTQDISEWKVTDVVPSLNPEIQHVYVQQMYQGIPIENGRYKLTVKKGEVTWAINKFIGDVATKAANTSLSLSPENAIMRVVSEYRLSAPAKLEKSSKGLNTLVYKNSGISLEPIQVDKVYMYKDGTLHLGWKVSLYQLDGQHWWNTIIDGKSGAILHSEDWVINCSFETPDHSNHKHKATEKTEDTSAIPYNMTSVDATLVGGGSYNVYPLGIESPNHGSRTIVSDPANATASPFGWHDTNGVAGAEFTTTRGNNVLAQDDVNGNNGNGARPDGGNELNFDFPINLNNNPSTYLSAATTNLFYWNNIMHDVWYQYGFNEASGNFQENNYGKGGAGSDSVNADAQDGSRTNNANFATPPDGSNPRMQMFLFTNPTRDGDLDNVIIAHEYGHGISTRLVGGPGTNALGGSEQMGEGWSDWFGLVMTIRPGDNRNTARGVGTYAIGQTTTGAGIRPTRYSTDLAVNGTDYGDISSLAVPHGVGYGFATILWDMTWDLIDLEGYDNDQYNGTGGNNIAMALVIEGLKNTANNPGYVSGRDGILQADQDLYGGQYNCLIWDAFARRGVGVNAVENTNGGTNSNNDQTTSFTSGCATPPTDSCNSTVASFPYNEGFENTLGAWSQATGDDFDWTVNSGGTPSNDTGPSAANEGTFYVYVEASDPNFGNKTTILNSPCFNLSSLNNAAATFSYQMTGSAVGVVRLEAREDGSQTWTEIWSQSGDQGAAWQNADVSLAAFSGTVQLRFRATTADSWQGDIAIDGFGIDEQGTSQGCTTSVSLPYDESFEANFGLWTQAGGDDLDWTRDSGGTPSNNTGPSTGSDGTFYVYVEASGDGTGFPNKRAILNSPCFDLSNQTEATFIFDYHMFGSTDGGSVDLEASTDNGATWTSIWSQTGNQGNQWNTVTIDLAGYVGSSVQLRFNRVTGGTWQSDVALDNARVISGSAGSGCAGGETAPYSEGFESNIGLWTQASGDDLNWTRDSGGTPSNNTGPSTGSDGTFYVYVEASGDGTGFPNKRAIINSPCLDLNNAASATFSFDYHMFGSTDGGRVDLEISDDGGTSWTSIWNQTGNQGNQWNAVSVDLSPYIGGGVQLRFNRVTGGTWQSDVAIDNIALSASSTSSFDGSSSQEEISSNTTFDFSIFPNPVTRGELTIKVTGAEAQKLTIYNMLGQVVRKEVFTKTVDVSNLDAGVYILEIEVNGTTFNKRFIKK